MDNDIKNLLTRIDDIIHDFKCALDNGDVEYSESMWLGCSDIEEITNQIRDALKDCWREEYIDEKYPFTHDRCHWHNIEENQPFYNGLYLLRMKSHWIIIGKKVKKDKYVTVRGDKDITQEIEMWANLPKLH